MPMLLCINYADEKFRPWQQLQTQTAHLFGADKVREYSPKDIPADFYEKNKFILDQKRGAGYWLWKPLIIKDALASVDFGDYVFYVDSGAFYVRHVSSLLDVMNRENTDVMCFGGNNNYLERVWSKRDAFILMDCDSEEYANTPQRGSGFIFLKKSAGTIALIDEWLEYMQDPRIVTDMPNQLGKENYAGFKENRHDQTAWSLLTKKHGIKAFRDPSQFGEFTLNSDLPKDVLDRSTYPTIFYLHRRAVGFNRTIEDFLRIYANEPKLCEGMRTAKYLLKEDMIKEAYEVLRRLLQKYQDGNDAAWLSTWDDLRYIFIQHKNHGAPYAEIFQPLLFKLLLQILRRGISFTQVPQLVSLAACAENKNLIPKEFQDALAYLVGEYIKQVSNIDVSNKPLPTAQEILNSYRELNMPTPLSMSYV